MLHNTPSTPPQSLPTVYTTDTHPYTPPSHTQHPKPLKPLFSLPVHFPPPPRHSHTLHFPPPSPHFASSAPPPHTPLPPLRHPSSVTHLPPSIPPPLPLSPPPTHHCPSHVPPPLVPRPSSLPFQLSIHSTSFPPSLPKCKSELKTPTLTPAHREPIRNTHRASAHPLHSQPQPPCAN